MQLRKLPKSQLEINITVSAKELEIFLNLAAEELSKDVKISGFRPGKAPRNIVEQKVGSEKVLAHAAEKAVKKTYVDAVKKNKVEAIGEPQVTITKIAPGNDLEYKAVVSVMPEITLSDYRKKAKVAKKEAIKETKNEEIEKELEKIQKSRAKLITVLREARSGDRVEIDFEVIVDGAAIDGGISKNHPLTIGENYFIPGFEDKLVGMKGGAEKEFDLPFPKDYHKKDLAGKKALFRVKMNLVQEKELPKIDDDFAKSLGNFENLEKLKDSVREGMEMEKKKKGDEKWRRDLLEMIIADMQTEIPDILLENELEKMMAELEQNIASMGMKIDDYLASMKKSREELQKDWSENAKKRVNSALVLQEIAKLEEINPDTKEIEEEMNKTLAYFKNQGNLEKNVDMERLYNYIKGVQTNEKVFDFLETLSRA